MLRELRRQFDDNIPPDEKGFRSMPLKIFERAFGYEIKKKALWQDMLALKNETLSYNFLSKDGEGVQYGAGFVSEWKIYATRLEFKLPSFVEDVVRGLDAAKAIFQLLDWEIFNHFTGKYEAIIYKLCRDYRGVKKTPYMELAKFREYMGLEPSEYKEFRDLNKFVISGPLKAINASEVSDISVSVVFERQGRRVIGLRFLIEPKQQSLIPFQELVANEVFRFARVPIEPELQMKYLGIRPEREIELCIERANEYGEQQAKKGGAPNYGALYRKAITEGWHVTQQTKLEEEAKQTQRKAATEKVLRAQEEERKAGDKAVLERINKTLRQFAALPEEEQDEIRELFRATLQTPLRKSFDKQGETAPMIRSLFAAFLDSREKA